MGNVFFVRDEKESIAVQEALFSVGIYWHANKSTPSYLNDHFIFHNGRELTGSCDDFEMAVGWLDVGCNPLDGKIVIENPMVVGGAKQPDKMITVGGKEYSESTIQAALRQYVG